MDEKIVKKFLKQKCLGYSSDFRKTHWEHTIEYEDGTIDTVYSTDSHGEIGERFEKRKPFVAMPSTEKVVKK